MRVWTASPCLQKICPFSTPCKKLARSEAWRPAAAARNRSPREAREVARQALRPGCEELAARIRVMPETEARPRGEKSPRWSAENVPRYGTQGASQAPDTPRYGGSHGCLARTRTFLGAPPTPRFG